MSRRVPKRIAVVSKCSTEEILEATAEVVDFLRGRVALVGDPVTAGKFHLRVQRAEALRADLVLCIGGDGTILRTLRGLRRPIPLLGVNLGAMGFLADLSPREMLPALREILKGFEVEERMRLSVHVGGRELPPAANEAVLLTRRPAKMLHLSLRAGGEELAELRADGVVLSTPMGSTAYAMSAGGPLVDPRLDAILVVPLAAFTLAARPTVVPADTRITVRILNEKEATLVLDGQQHIRVPRRAPLEVTRSPRPALFVRTGSSFYSKVRGKLVE
ncbi:MAG: NAD(+)/NADH kinase [Euryarchaeota archaeon]|nr:NAD(+)/NADH kinase [Euryarchaeota archaeon]